jgi:hypothetical protein
MQTIKIIVPVAVFITLSDTKSSITTVNDVAAKKEDSVSSNANVHPPVSLEK